jgi:hypothetical protein
LNNPPAPPTCAANTCPSVLASGEIYDDPDSVDTFVVPNPAALDCALAALRDGTPGVLRWNWEAHDGQITDEGYILIRPDRIAVRRDWGWDDLSFEVGPALSGQLPLSAHYTDCLADPDPATRFDCLRETWVAGGPVCDEGWLGGSI